MAALTMGTVSISQAGGFKITEEMVTLGVEECVSRLGRVQPGLASPKVCDTKETPPTAPQIAVPKPGPVPLAPTERMPTEPLSERALVPPSRPQPITPRKEPLPDNAIELAGKVLTCHEAETVSKDRSLPNLGAAAPVIRTMWINPSLLKAQPPIVQWFVFYHECGHLNVGPSEMNSDAYALMRVQKDGLLNAEALQLICAFFGDAPGTDTHPSGRRRCDALKRQYQTLARR